MVKYLFAILVSIVFSTSLAYDSARSSDPGIIYNVDDLNFWREWKRDTSLETNIFNLVKSDRLSARELVNRATEANPEYAFYVGLLYYLGYEDYASVPFQRDHLKALRYFNMAKSERSLIPYINYYTGMILLNGYDGVAINKERGKQFLSHAGTPEAFLVLAAVNYDNPKEQLKWYTQLAYTGEWRAMLTVARWYEIGRGTSKNMGEAYYWYNETCQQNIEFACDKLKTFNL